MSEPALKLYVIRRIENALKLREWADRAAEADDEETDYVRELDRQARDAFNRLPYPQRLEVLETLGRGEYK